VTILCVCVCLYYFPCFCFCFCRISPRAWLWYRSIHTHTCISTHISHRHMHAPITHILTRLNFQDTRTHTHTRTRTHTRMYAHTCKHIHTIRTQTHFTHTSEQTHSIHTSAQTHSTHTHRRQWILCICGHNTLYSTFAKRFSRPSENCAHC